MKPFILTVTLCAAAMAQTATKTDAPKAGTKAPATKAPATKAPATATKAPTTATKAPAGGTKAPATGTKAPATAAKAPAAKAPATVGNLLDPSTLKATAPAVFKAKFTTTKGDIVIEAHRDWAPLGADRFYNLVRGGFFTDVYFFRVIPGFMAQFGVSSRPEVAKAWRGTNLVDEPVKQSNKRGMVTFAHAGPNTRTTQLFINFGDNVRLDGMGFPAFGTVVEGMEVAEQFYTGYNAQFGGDSGQIQGPLGEKGKAFILKEFPKLDRIITASIVPGTAAAPAATKAVTKAPATTKSGTPATKSGTPATKAPATKAPATKAPATKAPAAKAPAVPAKQ